MKVKCIDNTNSKYLIIGKTYEVIREDNFFYIIKDNNELFLYDKFKFTTKTLSTIRNEKIDKLLTEIKIDKL